MFRVEDSHVAPVRMVRGILGVTHLDQCRLKKAAYYRGR